jgi:hypothetical protein
MIETHYLFGVYLENAKAELANLLKLKRLIPKKSAVFMDNLQEPKLVFLFSL